MKLNSIQSKSIFLLVIVIPLKQVVHTLYKDQKKDTKQQKNHSRKLFKSSTTKIQTANYPKKYQQGYSLSDLRVSYYSKQNIGFPCHC